MTLDESLMFATHYPSNLSWREVMSMPRKPCAMGVLFYLLCARLHATHLPIATRLLPEHRVGVFVVEQRPQLAGRVGGRHHVNATVEEPDRLDR